MKMELALRLMEDLANRCGFTEVKLTEASEAIYDDNETEYDLLVEDGIIFQNQIQTLTQLLLGYEHIGILIELGEMKIRIYEKEKVADNDVKAQEE